MLVVTRNARAPSLGLFVLALVLACSGRRTQVERSDPTAGAPTGGTENAGGQGGSTQGGSGLLSFGGGNGGTTPSGGIGGIGASTGGTAGYAGFEADPDACASVHMESLPKGPRVFIAVDRSSAMADAWSDVSAALADFLSRPELNGAFVALRFFPDDEPVPSCDATSCSATACQGQLVGPARLSSAPIGEDAHEAALVAALEAAEPTADAAPLGAAFEGLVQAASAPLMPIVGRTTGLFVTAGVPSECDGEFAETVKRTFDEFGLQVSIAVPETLMPSLDLDAVAANAGTSEVIRFSQSGEPLLDSVPLVAILVSCEVPLTALEGLPFDADRTMALVAIDGAEPRHLLHVTDMTECGMELAWYFDDNDMPATLIFCPALCLALTSSDDTTFDAYFYCNRGLGGPP